MTKEITLEDLAIMVQNGFVEQRTYMDERFDEIDRRFDHIETEIQEIKIELKALRKDLEDLRFKLSECVHKDDFRALEVRLAHVEKQLALQAKKQTVSR